MSHNNTCLFQEQIHLAPHIIIWSVGFISLIISLLTAIVLSIRRLRGHHDLTQAQADTISGQFTLVVTGYLLNYLPYFLSDQQLFAYCYLPALIYAVMSIGILSDWLLLLSARLVLSTCRPATISIPMGNWDSSLARVFAQDQWTKSRSPSHLSAHCENELLT